jgi:hypothetical protein
MSRFIGIRHRVKRTAEGEARPTQLVIAQNSAITTYDLEDETAELDWVLGRFPVKFRTPESDENLDALLPRHIVWRKLKEDEKPKDFLTYSIRNQWDRRGLDIPGKWEIASKVPERFDGLKPGDTVAMILGGSGDKLAYAMSRRAEEIHARIYRIPPAQLKERRLNNDKENDAVLLADLVQTQQNLFYLVGSRDRKYITLREALQARMDAMKARVGCEQRLRQRMIGGIFCSAEGLYPEGSVEDVFAAEKASDTILAGLTKEERQRDTDLEKAIEALDVYQVLFKPIKGVGPRIAAGLIAAIGDIRRFATDANLKAFCGVHVLPDGRIPRQRHSEIANWHPDARQALYLLGDQFNRHPDSLWGQKLREYKEKFRLAHPQEEVAKGNGAQGKTKRYTPSHIHKMALWRTLTKFTEWLWREWWRLEKQARAEAKMVA